MGVAHFFVFNKSPGFDTYVSGKAIAQADESLAKLARKLKVRPLSEFLSMSSEDVADAIEDFDLPGGVATQVEAEQWFAPDEVLATVRALSKHIKSSPKSVSNATDILADLALYEDVLLKAKRKRLKCHLSIDI